MDSPRQGAGYGIAHAPFHKAMPPGWYENDLLRQLADDYLGTRASASIASKPHQLRVVKRPPARLLGADQQVMADYADDALPSAEWTVLL